MNKEMRNFLDARNAKLDRPTPTGGSPFGNTIASGIKRSCIMCGTHHLISNLTHWRSGQYRCKEGCKK